MPASIIRVSKLILLILGSSFLILFIILPLKYFLIIISSFLLLFCWCWYKENFEILDFRILAKPLQFLKIPRNVKDSNRSNGPNVTSKAKIKDILTTKTRKFVQGDVSANNSSFVDSYPETIYQKSISQRKYKSVQTAGGPLLFHEKDSYNSSFMNSSSSFMHENSFSSNYQDSHRKFSYGSGFLGQSDRSMVSARRRYPTHQSNYIFLGQFPTINLNKPETPNINLNNSFRSHVMVKLAPPQVLTPSQRMNFSVTLSPTNLSPKNIKSVDLNPCDTKTVLAALKENNRKRLRKDKDNVVENDAKRRRQETDSESSDSSIMITTGPNQNNDDITSDILMKTLQGKRPATPMGFYDSPTVQSLSKRHKNDILTVSYSSSRKCFKEDALLILPKKRQAANSSPSPASKVSKVRDSIENEEIHIDLTLDNTLGNENSNLIEPIEIEEMNKPMESEISSPIHKEGQSHKRTLPCYADLGKTPTNVYNVPQYIPTLDDCQEHKKIEIDRVRKLLGSPIVKNFPAVSMPEIKITTSSTVPFSKELAFNCNPENTSVTSTFSFGSTTSTPTLIAAITKGKDVSPAAVTTVWSNNTSVSHSLPTSVVNTEKSTPLVIQPSEETIHEATDTVDNEKTILSTDPLPKELNVAKPDHGSTFLNSFLTSVGKETPLLPITKTSTSSNATLSFTEAFKFSSSPKLLNTNPSATNTATSASVTVEKGPSIPQAAPLNMPFNSPALSQASVTTSTFTPNPLTGITIKNASSGFGSNTFKPVLSFGQSENVLNSKMTSSPFGTTSETASLTLPSSLLTVENHQKQSEEKTTDLNNTSSGIFSFSSTKTDPSNTFQFLTTPSSQPAATNSVSNTFQFSNPVSKPLVTNPTPASSFQFSGKSNLTTQSTNMSLPVTPFQFSSGPAQPTTVATNPTPFSFKSQTAITQPSTTLVSSSGTSMFSFGLKTTMPSSLTPLPSSTQPSSFFSPPVDSTNTGAFGTSSALPSYSDALASGTITSQSTGQNQSISNSSNIFGSNTSSSIFPQSTPNFSFGTQATEVSSSVSSPFGNSNQPAFANGFGSTQNNAFGNMPSAQLSFGSNPTPATSIQSSFGATDATKNTNNNFMFNSNVNSQPNAFGNPQTTTPAFQFNLSSKNFNFGSSPAIEQPTFGAPQINQPYVFGGAPVVAPVVDPNAVPGSQLFSIGSGVREKRVAATRRRPRK